MLIKFHIHYNTQWGQQLFVCGSHPLLGKWKTGNASPLVFRGNGKWDFELQVDAASWLEYKYFIQHPDGNIEWEFGDNRPLNLKGDTSVRDFWRSNHHSQNVLFTSPFRHAFFPYDLDSKGDDRGSGKANLRLQIRIPHIKSGHQVAVVGNCKALGDWQVEKAVPLKKQGLNWIAAFKLSDSVREVDYKYVLLDDAGELIGYETGSNRYFVREPSESTWINDEYFGHPMGDWKGAGVAIPVFSLRTNSGSGVGEFLDLIPLVDWAGRSGLKLVQLLPVNDTIATHTWVDSYPYAAISVFALHPLYANIQDIGALKDLKKQQEINRQASRLNELETVDYEEVMKLKSRYFKLKFDEVREQFMRSKAFKTFFKENKKWLVPYACFSYLRDLYQTADFTKWKKYREVSPKDLEKLSDPKAKNYGDIAVHYFIQYHLDQQLGKATAYAREKGIVLKGDIPIGIYRHSADAWTAPHLYHMDGQSGAPPDAFSQSGQNWGFPTYNWEGMAKDGYTWWKDRLKKMSDYFDVFRIDHILGFFRIWEIPWSAVEGTLGRFNPSLPLSVDELSSWGIQFNYDRFCKPYIREYMVNEIFGELAQEVRKTYLAQVFPGAYELKEEFSTQRKIKEYFESVPDNDDNRKLKEIEQGLYRLAREVLLIETANDGDPAYNPNIDLYNTYSFKDLESFQQNQLLELHRQYFFHRHNDFWKEKAMEKLPAIKEATDMLVCGEDLGMVPDSVPGVMADLQILSLAIQRMPNDNTKEFWHPADTPYLSVCSTSSHDTSTLRQWWEEDREKTQRFYNQILGNGGEAPFYCEPWVVEQVIKQHLYSPSMWAIFPIQDLLALDGELRRVFPQEEHINRPEIIPHYWRYRLHLNVDELIGEDEFNDHLKQMVYEAGRNQ